MKAAMLNVIGQPLIIEDMNEPTPRAGEVLVRVLATPVLAYTKAVFARTRENDLALPLVPGSGAIGIVEKTGPDATRIVPGQLVFCDPTVRSRDDSLTPDVMLQGWAAHGEGAQKLQAYFHHGSFADKVLVPLENAIPLEGLQNMDPVKLTWLGTMLVAFGGLLAANVQPGQVVMVNGSTGHFGGAGVAIATAMGVERVVALGRDQKKLDALVQKFGNRVRPVQFSEDEKVTQRRIHEAAGRPIDSMLDLLGAIRDTQSTRQGIMALRQGGTAVLMGGVDADIVLPYRYIMHNNLTIRGQYMYPRYAPQLLTGLIRGGLLDMDAFATHAFPLSEANQAIEFAHEHGGAFQLTVLKP